MMRHILKHQTFITLFLFTLFFIVIIAQILYPAIDLKSTFAIITGWLGIIIGFFFNQQFADHLREKLNLSLKERRIFAEKSESVEKEYTKMYEERYEKLITEYERTINEILKKSKFK